MRDESIFRNSYINAIKIINNIRGENKSKTKDLESTYNNLVVFEGDRGTGKTSCMLSVSQCYKTEDREQHYDDLGEMSKDILISDIIDPSVLENESIIEILLANMLEKAKNKLEEDYDNENKANIIRAFEKVFADLKIINSDKEEIYRSERDNLESLLFLSSGVSLKKHLHELVEKYLRLFDK